MAIHDYTDHPHYSWPVRGRCARAKRGQRTGPLLPASGLALAGILSAGLRLTLSGNWLVGGELEGVFPNRHKLEGTIVPTPNGNVHDVWPGQWDLSDLFGAGGNIIFGRASEDGRGRSVWDKALRVAPLRFLGRLSVGARGAIPR